MQHTEAYAALNKGGLVAAEQLEILKYRKAQKSEKRLKSTQPHSKILDRNAEKRLNQPEIDVKSHFQPKNA